MIVKRFLKRYFEACALYDFKPNPLLLAQILIKSEKRPHRQEVVRLIQAQNVVKEEHRKAAYQELLKAAEWLILSQADFDETAKQLAIDGNLIREHAVKLLDAYLAYQDEKVLGEIIKGAVGQIKLKYPELFKVKGKEIKKEQESVTSQTSGSATPPPVRFSSVAEQTRAVVSFTTRMRI